MYECNRRHTLDSVLRRLVALEYEVHLFNGDLVGKERQLVDNLTRLQARLAIERLREEQEPHAARQPREVFTQPLLIGRRDQSHEAIMCALGPRGSPSG